MTDMTDQALEIQHRDPSLYNDDLAPIKKDDRTWGWFEIFNVWSNDIQSLFGYTLAASLFISYGLNGWAVMAAIILAGVVVMWLVNLTGKPSVKYGVPFPVMIRASMGCAAPTSRPCCAPSSASSGTGCRPTSPPPRWRCCSPPCSATPAASSSA